MELRCFESPGKEWDEFAERHTDLIFYRSQWSEVLKRGLGGEPLYFYLKEGGEIVAGLPGVLLRFGMLRILYSSVPYGGLIGDRSSFLPSMELLDREFMRRGIDQLRIVASPFSESRLSPLFKQIVSRCTLLDLTGFDKDSIWKEYKKNIRRDVRKAQRSGVTLREASSKEEIKGFYQLFTASMERNRAAAKYPFRWFEAIHEVIVKKGLGSILLAMVDQTAVAGAVFIYSPSATHYLHNGSRDEFLKFCPNELLIHSAIEKAIENRHSFFDFMGSDINDAALLRFKEKWGGQSLDIHTSVKDYRPFRCKVWEFVKGLGNSRVGRRALKMMRR
jgi:CelD/BcsL family acetyltransferase involved in cellulose biosynthesis